MKKRFVRCCNQWLLLFGLLSHGLVLKAQTGAQLYQENILEADNSNLDKLYGKAAHSNIISPAAFHAKLRQHYPESLHAIGGKGPKAGPENVCKQARQLLQTLRNYHVDPPTDKQMYSEKVLHQFIQHLDPQGLYLTREQISTLNPLFQQIEEAIVQGDCRALKIATDLFSRQYHFVDSLRQQLLAQPLSYGQDTLAITLSRQPSYAADNKELQKRWRQQIKYLLLYEAYGEAGERKISLAEEARLRRKVQERMNCRRSRLMANPGGLEGYVAEQFLQALATAFDPHTNYLPPAVKEQFMASLSVQTESFGIELEESPQGDIQIYRIIPGGPAWKSNELHEGDILLSLRAKKGPLREFTCSSLEEAEELLSEAAFKHAFLTVRKKSGQIKTVELIKEKLQVEENVVTSLILKGSKAIGYVSLPAFYTQLDGTSKQGASSDVAKAIIQLKKEGIAGLILDLRFNGGGSVMEALSLAGIFIDEGPLGVEMNKGEKPRLLKDLNRGVLYDGPLIILVNGFSASASEILALALQDYNRALVVGSPTYGKATMQSMIPLAGPQPGRSPKPQDPFLKVTVGKYYGVMSNSYQAKGVIPDVLLEDGLAAYNMNEAAYPTALKADRVDKKVVFQALAPLPRKAMADKSLLRLGENQAYKAQQLRASSLTMASKKGFPLRLNPEHFKEDYDLLIKLSDEGSSTQGNQQAPFEMHNLPATEELLKLNANDLLNNQRLKEELAQDLWLAESFQIMLDLLETKKGN